MSQTWVELPPKLINMHCIIQTFQKRLGIFVTNSENVNKTKEKDNTTKELMGKLLLALPQRSGDTVLVMIIN